MKRPARGKRHMRFRNRCVQLLKYEKRWMTANEIFAAFMDGPPATLTTEGTVSNPRYVPNPQSQITMILKYDKRLEHRKAPRSRTAGCMIDRKNSNRVQHMVTEWRAKNENESEVG